MVVGHARHLQLVADRLLLSSKWDLLLLCWLATYTYHLRVRGFTTSVFEDLLLYLGEALTLSMSLLVAHTAVRLSHIVQLDGGSYEGTTASVSLRGCHTTKPL